MGEYVSLLKTANNTRTVGGIHPALALLRSGAVTALCEEDILFLRDKGITDLIDLRTDEEVRRKPCTAGEFGFVYHHLPITEGSVPPAHLDEVPLTYMRIASAGNMAAVFRCIAQAEGGTLFFCTAGKDRTGVVSAVLQLLCGVDRDIIIKDYTLSREYNRALLEAYLSAHPDIDRSVVLANECSMERFIELFLEKYGSPMLYLKAAGLDDDTAARLMKRLTGGGH